MVNQANKYNNEYSFMKLEKKDIKLNKSYLNFD